MLHATAVAVGARGVLIRGAAGSGKTSLAHALLARAAAAGGFARFVSDDRVVVTRVGGRLVLSPPASIAGLAEIRGRGVVAVAHEPAAVLALVVDLVAHAERMPEEEELVERILAVSVPRQPIGSAAPDPAGLVLAALAASAPPAAAPPPFLLARPAAVPK